MDGILRVAAIVGVGVALLYALPWPRTVKNIEPRDAIILAATIAVVGGPTCAVGVRPQGDAAADAILFTVDDEVCAHFVAAARRKASR